MLSSSLFKNLACFCHRWRRWQVQRSCGHLRSGKRRTEQERLRSCHCPDVYKFRSTVWIDWLYAGGRYWAAPYCKFARQSVLPACRPAGRWYHRLYIFSWGSAICYYKSRLFML